MATKRQPTPAQLEARRLFAERARSGAFKRKKNGPAERHQLKIARSTLRMPKAMQGVMGGPTVRQAALTVAGAKKKKRRNSRGFSGAAPAWTKTANKRAPAIVLQPVQGLRGREWQVLVDGAPKFQHPVKSEAREFAEQIVKRNPAWEHLPRVVRKRTKRGTFYSVRVASPTKKQGILQGEHRTRKAAEADLKRFNPDYKTRFIQQKDAADLVNLYHLARVPLSGQKAGRYERMLVASKWFAKEHPGVSSTGAYKDLDGLLGRYNPRKKKAPGDFEKRVYSVMGSQSPGHWGHFGQVEAWDKSEAKAKAQTIQDEWNRHHPSVPIKKLDLWTAGEVTARVKRRGNPGVIRFSEAEAKRYTGKIKGMSSGSASRRSSKTKRGGGILRGLGRNIISGLRTQAGVSGLSRRRNASTKVRAEHADVFIHNPKHRFSTDNYVAIDTRGIVKAAGSQKAMHSLAKSKGWGVGFTISGADKVGTRFGGPRYVEHGGRGRGSRAKRRAAARGLTFNPKGEHLPGLPAKYQRMYEDILASAVESGRYKGREKEVAARTVRAAVEGRTNPYPSLYKVSKRQKRERRVTRAKRQRIVAFRQHGIRPATRKTGPGRLPNPRRLPRYVEGRVFGKGSKATKRAQAKGLKIPRGDSLYQRAVRTPVLHSRRLPNSSQGLQRSRRKYAGARKALMKPRGGSAELKSFRAASKQLARATHRGRYKRAPQLAPSRLPNPGWKAFETTFSVGKRRGKWLRFAPSAAHHKAGVQKALSREYGGAAKILKIKRVANPGPFSDPTIGYKSGKQPGHWEMGFRGKGRKAQKRARTRAGSLKGYFAHSDRATLRKYRGGPLSASRLPNPSPARVFSQFRGKDATTKTQVRAARGTPSTLAKLGQLRELKLRNRALRFGAGASLAADGRKRLHVVGTRFKVRGNPEGSEVDMGEIIAVTYRADKPHIEKGVFDYVHKFGEDGGVRPHLIVDEEGYPLIEGGSYDIDEDGIID